MHKVLIKWAAAALVPAMTFSAPSAQAQNAAQAEAFSVETTKVEALLQNPAATEILKRIIPTVYANENFQTMGRSQTLRFIQQFEPEALSDAVLKQLQAEFDKLAAR